MSSLSNSETAVSLQASNNNLKLKKKYKLSKIKKTLLNLEKEEVISFNPLKVKVYKNEIGTEHQNNKIEIIIPITLKHYFEDIQKYRGLVYQIESGIISSNTNLIQTEQVDSSDLVNSE